MVLLHGATDLPDDLWTHVLTGTSLGTLFALRDVCCDLRAVVDEVVLPSRRTVLRVYVDALRVQPSSLRVWHRYARPRALPPTYFGPSCFDTRGMAAEWVTSTRCMAVTHHGHLCTRTCVRHALCHQHLQAVPFLDAL